MSSIQPSSFSKKFTSSLSLTGVRFTGRELGRGSDAVVVEADHQGTLCAAKKLHQILLDDQSPGGAQRLVANFENEITTWYSLRHPHIVLLLGVQFEQGSHIPTLFLEKMQSSLRRYVETYKKEEVSLQDKVFILRQVSQALAYLHSRQPPLVHHDLSPNNILLNQDSLLTKITDFGMSRVVDPSHATRKSSVKGTLAFMPPEALVNPPRYTEKLDIFSFGNITLFTVTHLWPEPGPPVVLEGDKVIGVLELQRREQYTRSLTVEERSSFFAMIRSCLENRPDRRPTSLQLVQQMRQMEEAHPRPAHSRESNTTAQLTQQLKVKDDQLKVKDDQLKVKDDQLKEKDEQLKVKDEQLKVKDEQLKVNNDQLKEKDDQLQQMQDQMRRKDEESSREYALPLQEYQRIQQESQRHQESNQRLQQERDVSQPQVDRVQSTAPTDRRFSPSPVQPPPIPQRRHKTPALPHSSSKPPPRNWRELKCQKTLKCGEYCYSIAVQGDVVCVGVHGRVLLFSKTSGAQVSGLGSDQIKGKVWGVAFIEEDTIVVSADRLRTYTTKGQLVSTFDSGKDGFEPRGLTVGPDRRIFVCDYGNDCVCVFNVDGKLLSSFGSKGSGVGYFNYPRDVCMDGEGLLFISDGDNSRICVHSVEGAFIREFPTPRKPTCVAATHCNHLVVSSVSSHTVMIMTTSGQLVHEFGGAGRSLGEFICPLGVAVDNEDFVYVCDLGNKRVQVY